MRHNARRVIRAVSGNNQQLFVAKRQDGDGFNPASETPNIE
jgi:hypothetical protein